jgi:hypothetical protein
VTPSSAGELALRALARRVTALTVEERELGREIETLTRKLAPQLPSLRIRSAPTRCRTCGSSTRMSRCHSPDRYRWPDYLRGSYGAYLMSHRPRGRDLALIEESGRLAVELRCPRPITSIGVAAGVLVLAAGALICLEIDGLSPLTRTRVWRPPFTRGGSHQPTNSGAAHRRLTKASRRRLSTRPAERRRSARRSGQSPRTSRRRQRLGPCGLPPGREVSIRSVGPCWAIELLHVHRVVHRCATEQGFRGIARLAPSRGLHPDGTLQPHFPPAAFRGRSPDSPSVTSG